MTSRSAPDRRIGQEPQALVWWDSRDFFGPSAWLYRPQPFSVELKTGSIARTVAEKSQLRARVSRLGSSAVFYTPDFYLQWASGAGAALEVAAP